EDGGGGTGVWVGNRDPGAPGLFFFRPQDPPAALETPTVALGCRVNGAPLAVWDYVVLGVGRIAHESALAGVMDRIAFPVDPFPEESVTPTTAPGPRFSSCSVSYESSVRTITGIEGTTDPGAIVVLGIEVGTLLYADLATAVAGHDGKVVIPDFNLDTLTTPIPAGATITVVLTADENHPGACRLRVET
ncbi:MAG: hypothetical protein H6Q11_1253, partial [Acidobacteria bacterium]|nr:hypothetical protein [Acidobacteriota bacterium]